MIILVGVACAVIIAFFIAFAIITKKKIDEMDYSEDRVRCYMPQWTKGSKEGIFKKLIPCGNGLSLLIFEPLDLDDEEIKNVKVVVRDDLTEIYPKGTESNVGQVIEVYPPRSELLPEHIKNTNKGKEIMARIESKSAEKFSVDVIRNRQEVEDKLLMLDEGGDRIVNFMEMNEAFMKDLARIKNNSDKKGGVDYPTGR